MLDGATVSEREDRAIPQTLQNLQETVCNFIAVQQQLYPSDVTPVTVLRLLVKYKWLSQAGDMSLKSTVIQEYFSNISKQNSTRAINGRPTLSFADHEAALNDVMLRHGLNPFPPVTIPRLEQRQNNDRGASRPSAGAGNRGGAGSRGRSGNGGLSRPNPTYQGAPVCYSYNSFEKDCKNSLVPGGCKDSSGRFFAHVCTRWVAEKNTFCLGKHRKRDHK